MLVADLADESAMLDDIITVAGDLKPTDKIPGHSARGG
jgi:hypothetical protein